MNFYYDILVNLQDEFYEFYEWERDDFILAIKKTPLFKVKHQVIVDFLSYEIVLDNDFIENIKNKTICKNSKDKINGFLISDCKTSLFVEVRDGKVIFKSKLLVEDENNINEIVNALKVFDLKYQVGDKKIKGDLLRRTVKEKKLILMELDNLKVCENVDLYFELFHESPLSYKDALIKMKDYLDNNDSMVIHHLAHLIDISYQERL